MAHYLAFYPPRYLLSTIKCTFFMGQFCKVRLRAQDVLKRLNLIPEK